MLQLLVWASSFLMFLMEKANKLLLTNDDEARGLEKLFIVPRGMLCFQDVTHSVVLSQPQRSVHPQTGKKSEHLLTDSHLTLRRDSRWVAHLNGSISNRWRVHLAVNQLQSIITEVTTTECKVFFSTEDLIPAETCHISKSVQFIHTHTHTQELMKNEVRAVSGCFIHT